MIDNTTNKVTVVVKNSADFNFMITYNPANKDIYVPMGFHLFVVSSQTNKVVANVPSGGAMGSAFNPSNNEVYIVENQPSGSISVVAF